MKPRTLLFHPTWDVGHPHFPQRDHSEHAICLVAAGLPTRPSEGPQLCHSPRVQAIPLTQSGPPSAGPVMQAVWMFEREAGKCFLEVKRCVQSSKTF